MSLKRVRSVDVDVISVLSLTSSTDSSFFIYFILYSIYITSTTTLSDSPVPKLLSRAHELPCINIFDCPKSQNPTLDNKVFVVHTLM